VLAHHLPLKGKAFVGKGAAYRLSHKGGRLALPERLLLEEKLAPEATDEVNKKTRTAFLALFH